MFRLISNLFAAPAPKPAAKVRLSVETMEDRMAPALFTSLAGLYDADARGIIIEGSRVSTVETRGIIVVGS